MRRQNKSGDELFSIGLRSLESRDPLKAIAAFQEIERTNPEASGPFIALAYAVATYERWFKLDKVNNAVLNKYLRT